MSRTKTIEWVSRWGDSIAREPEAPGVWKREDGGYHIRGRATDPRTRKLREVNRALPDCKRASKAAAILEGALDEIRAGTSRPTSSGILRFADYAADLLQRKVSEGTIASAAGREKWATILKTHLIPRFGDWFLDAIKKRDIEDWKSTMTGYAPTTANTVLAVLKTILATAADDFEEHGLGDPSAKVCPFDTKAHRTYTAEEPNALRTEHVGPFLDEMRVRWPEHYAMVYLGMWTGLRPSSLRPLRRRGRESDVKWDAGELHVRRSHTVKSEVMSGTKNGDDLIIKLAPEVLDVLAWHVDRLDRENERRAKRSPDLAAAMAASDLLFPCEPNGRNSGGGFRSKDSLDRAFADVAQAISLPYRVTPRALRRSFQDLMRAGGVDPLVARAVCGHRTPAMQERYSTVALDEKREAMGKIISLASARAARNPPPLGSPPGRPEVPNRAPSPLGARR